MQLTDFARRLPDAVWQLFEPLLPARVWCGNSRRYPKDKYPRVVVLIDNAPWYGGELIQQALADHPNLELKRLPRYSPQLNVIERFWKLLRRRATHHRLFDTLANLKRSLRASLCYFQTVRQRIHTLIAKCYPQPVNQTASSGP